MANQKFRTAAELLEYQKKRFDQLQKTQGSDIQDGYDVLRSQGLNIPSYNDRMEYNANREYRSEERSLYEYQPPKKSIAPTQTMSTAYVEKAPVTPITQPTIQATQPTIQPSPQSESLPWYKKLLNWMNQGVDPEKQKAMQQVINTPTDQYFKSDTYKQSVKDTGPISAGYFKGSLAPLEGLRGIGNVATGMFKDKQLSDLIVGQQDTFKEPAQWDVFKQARAEEMGKKGFVGNIPETLSETMTAMLPSIAIGGVGGLTELGIQAGGGNAQQALDEGASPLQAGAYGAVTGTAEALYERLFGFIPGLKGLEGKALGNLLTRNASQNLRRSAFDFGKKMLGEGLEEVIMEPTQQISKGLLYDNSVSFNPLNKETYGDNGILPLRRMAESGALGVMAGSILGSVQLPSQISQSREMVADLQKNITDDLYVASNMPKNSMSYKMMDSLTQKGIDNVTFNEYSTLANTLRSEVQRMNNFEQQNQGAINYQPTILQRNAGTPQRKFYERGAASQFTPRVNQGNSQVTQEDINNLIDTSIREMPQTETNNAPINQVKGESILPNQNEGIKNDSTRSNNVTPSSKSFGGFFTPQIKGGNEISNISSSGLPEGRFIALDKPFESNYHDSSKTQKTNVEVKSIFDPDGLIDKSNQLKDKSVYDEMVNEIKLQNPSNMRKFMKDYLVKKGYDSYIRGIDGDRNNRELIVLDESIPIEYAPMTTKNTNEQNQSPDAGNMVEEQTQQTTETKPTTETTNKPSYQVGDTVISPSNKKYTIIGNEGKDYRIRSSDGKTTFPIRKEKLESGYKKEGTSQQESTNNQETVKEEPKQYTIESEYERIVDKLKNDNELFLKWKEYTDKSGKFLDEDRIVDANTYSTGARALINNALAKEFTSKRDSDFNFYQKFDTKSRRSESYEEIRKHYIKLMKEEPKPQETKQEESFGNISNSELAKQYSDFMETQNFDDMADRDTEDDYGDRLFSQIVDRISKGKATAEEMAKKMESTAETYDEILDAIETELMLRDANSKPNQETIKEEPKQQPDKIDVLVDKMTELVDTIKSNNATAPEEVKALEQKPHEKIADKVLNYIRDGKKLTNDILYSFADEAYGGTQTQGTYSVKDAHDAMELAVNKYILELPARKGDYPADEAIYGIKTFEGILNNLPTQGNNRSTEMQSFQQFSTPPSIAFVSSWLANINENDTMLEPSAGIGGLAVFAKRVGAKVYVNELSKRRLEVLRSLPFDRFFNENAEQLNNILPKDVKASVVVMNPPFSSTAGRTSKNSSLNAGVHIEQALKRLVPDGRLVAIVGHPMSDTSSQFSNFWKDIKSKYNVRANFSIDGKNYRKYGTTYDIRIVIIDNNGPTKTPVFTGHFEDINQVPKALEAIRNDRPSIEVKQDATVTRSNETSEQSGSQSTVSTPSTTRGEQGTRVSDKTPRTEVQQDSARPTSDDGTTGNIQQSDTVVPAGRDNEGTQTNQVEETETTSPTGVRSEQSERSNKYVIFKKGNKLLEKETGKIWKVTEVDYDEGIVKLQEIKATTNGAWKSWGTQTHYGFPVDEFELYNPNVLNENSNDVVTESELENSEEIVKSEEEMKSEREHKEENSDDVFSYYAPQKLKIKNTKTHPALLVESAAMGAVEPPDITYVPNLPQEIISNGHVSNAQLEFVSYAGQAHEQIMPNGYRRGIFNGDGTGVGKGTQIAALILDNFRRGRKKAVWISEKKGLVNDAIRDWSWVGQDPKQITSIESIGAKEDIPIKEGILFTTYSTSIMGTSVNNGVIQELDPASRLNQLVRWLGKDFDGVIVFDEAHNMSNALGDDASKTATVGIKLQELLPKARIAYFSATGATEVHNLAYATRLGLWGEGAPFKDVGDFVSKVSEGGLATMELVAKDLKSMGLYVARSISYKEVSYETLEHKITPVQHEIYNSLAKAWQMVITQTENAMEKTYQGKDSRKRAFILAQLFSNQQRFFNQILTSMSAPTLIKDIRAKLNDDKSVVLQLVNTEEAAQNRAVGNAIANEVSLDDIEISPKEMLLNYLNNIFPVSQMEEYEEEATDKFGNTKMVKKYRPVKDSEGNPVVNTEMVELRDSLIEDIKDLKTPDSIIDTILNTFGTDAVAEVTGRKKRLVKDPKTGKMKNETRAKNYKESDAEAFQRGDKRILIFSDAGGTGRSYHASVTAANQQQRVHYLVQPGWSAPKAMQGFGRTHRSAQVNAPMYNLVTTNIKGQKRFISTIAKRLDQMGALTRGERKASGGMFNAKDNLEGTIAKDTLMRFYKHLFNFATPDINGRDVLRRMNLLGKFTDKDGFWKDNPTVGYDTGTFMNRILQLEIDEQNYIFDEYMNRVEQATEAAERGGFLDLGLENYNADKIEILDDKVIRTDPITQAKTRYIQLKAYNKTQPIPYKNLETFDKGYMGIYRNTKTEEVRAVYKGNSITLENGNVEQSYKLYSVVLDRSQYTEKTLESRMEKVSENEGKQLWEDAYKSAPEYHEKSLHLFTGTLLPIWNKLPKGNVKVYRVKDSKGNEYLGRFIPPAEIDSTLRAFNADRTKQSYDVEKAYDDVVNKGKAISLENDNIVIKRSRVSGEYRIEIMGDNLRFLTRAYPQIIQERIQWKERYFIPVSEKGKDIFSKIIESNPIASIESNSDKFDSEGLTSSTGGPSIGRATGANTTGKAKRASEIFADFSKKLGVSVRQAKVGRNRLGEFDNNNYLIKIKDANDIPALSHETGHYLDRLYDLSTNRSHRTELEDLGKATSLPSYSKARIRREGVAEFVRLYLTDNNVARQTAPGFYTAFEQEIPEEVLDTLQELRKEIWALVNLDPVSRVERSISFHDDTNYMDKLKQIKDFDIFSAARKTYTGVIDATYPLEWAARKAGEKDYIQQKLAQMRGYEGIALFDINPNLHKDMYQTNLSGQKVGTSYGEITKEIHRNNEVRRKFMDYQVARRALDYYDKGLKMPDTLETYEENIRILELQYPEFKEIFKDLQTYRHNLSKLMVEGGIYSKEQLQDMIDANPNYVPLQRIMEGFDMVAGSGTLLGGAKKLMKRLQGSGRDIVDPEESDINNTFLYRAAAMRNKVLQDLTGMFDHKVNDNAVDGMGWLISRAPHKSQPVTFNLEQVKKQLEEAGVDTTGLDLDTMVRIFVPNYLAKENQIVVYREGKPVIYDVHPELYKAVQGMRFEQLEWITKPFAALASIQRAGIIFTDKYLLYNLSRDTFHGLVSSRANITPVDIVGGMMSALFRTQTYKDAMREGATTNYFSANDRNYTKDTIKDINNGYSLAKKFASKLPPWRWLRIIRDLTEPFEMASKVAEYKKLLKQTGNSAEAVYGARDLSIDFRRMGSWVKALQLNRVSLFLNSSLQGLDKTARMFRYNPIKTTLKGFLYITLPTLFLYWLNDDNEEYHNLPNWRRDFFWNIPIGDPKTTNIFLPIPKPFELGVIFGALPERLLRKYKEEDPKAWKDFGETIKRTFVPELKISAIQPEMDIMANRDWRNRPIISQSDEGVSERLQFNSYTSEIAKELGDFFGASPKKIEHLITGHFGTWGKTALDLSDAVMAPNKGSSDVSAFGKKFIVDSRQSPQSIEDFYDNYGEVTTAYKDAKRISGKPNALEKALNKEFSNVAEDLSKYRTWQTAVDIANVKNEKLINAAIQQMAIQKTKDVNKLYDKLKEIISNKK